jgi:hypothetical protein
VKFLYILLIIGVFSNTTYAKDTQASSIDNSYFKYVDKISWTHQQSYFYLKYDDKNRLVWALPIAYVDKAKMIKYVEPALTFKSYPSAKIQSVIIPTVLNNYLRKYNTLYFFDKDEKVKFTNSKIIGTLDDIQINGQKNQWRYPEFSEIQTNNLFKYEQSSFIGKDTYFSVIGLQTGSMANRGIAVYTECSSNKKITSGNYPKLTDCQGKFNKNLRYKQEHSVYDHPSIVVLVRKPNKYDKIIFDNNLTPVKKLSHLSTLLAQEYLSVKPVEIAQEVNYDVNIKFINAPHLYLSKITHTEDETKLTIKLKKRCRKCSLNSGGEDVLLLNNKPFKYFIYKQKKYKYSKENIKKVKFTKGEAIFVFDKLKTDTFTLTMGKKHNSWRLKDVDSMLKDTIFKPKKPQNIKLEVTKKGEFEKTSAYKKRVAQEQKKVLMLNEKNKEAYRLKMIEFDYAVNFAQQQYNKKVEQNKTETAIKKALNLAANQAINMLFGDPKFTNLIYDADKEVFNATLYSTLNDFSADVEIATPIDKAKNFKEKLTDKRLVLSVDFKITDNKLLFVNVNVVENKTKQEQEFKIAKEKNTIASYENYLKLYADAPQAKDAQEAIVDIKEKKRLQTLKQMQESKKRAKEAQARKQKEIESYMKRKKTGDKVCQDGRTALVLPITITAYVEQVDGDKIQLRISDTDGTSPYYNGVMLYKDTIIWDRYTQWKHCN